MNKEVLWNFPGEHAAASLETAKELIEAKRRVQDAKTARLKEARLAKEAANRAANPPEPKRPTGKKSKP